MNYMHHLFAVISILVGLRTIYTRETFISIQLFGKNESGTPPPATTAGYSTSHQTGVIAVLIGIAEIGVGLGILFKDNGII